MRGRGAGNVVLLGSIDGVKPAPSPVHYAASKGGARGHGEGDGQGAGAAEHPREHRRARRARGRPVARHCPDELRSEYLKHCGLKRFGRLEEVASLVAWLATENTLVTGQTMIVDGAL